MPDFASCPPAIDPQPELELSPEVLARLRAELRASERKRGLAQRLALARAVVQHVYDGDPSAWRSRLATAPSLRRLIETGIVPGTPSSLCRALEVFEVWSTVARGREWPRLTASHYRAVLDLPLAQQEELLEHAQRFAVPADRLREIVKRRAERRPSRGGRLPSHPIGRTIERIERELAVVDAFTGAAPDDRLEREEAANLAARSEGVARRCNDLARLLRRT